MDIFLLYFLPVPLAWACPPGKPKRIRAVASEAHEPDPARRKKDRLRGPRRVAKAVSARPKPR
ncbi:hypothetical protein HPC49_07460 [Pyxidicoccus fallax]|uniref:Uncharacterized protein n=1 Tax=Pyxidicoccus fallax TaxID=394095 RepID=A0A848L9K8_9BACT|nr:hypothetical protein [Pyxidicoccus fallax]NMO15529.1 hypothetical protein [Pyxidicoccus fallax]NPC78089.1 hypothetical protein [Pyxidicoccus fallax]